MQSSRVPVRRRKQVVPCNVDVVRSASDALHLCMDCSTIDPLDLPYHLPSIDKPLQHDELYTHEPFHDRHIRTTVWGFYCCCIDDVAIYPLSSISFVQHQDVRSAWSRMGNQCARLLCILTSADTVSLLSLWRGIAQKDEIRDQHISLVF